MRNDVTDDRINDMEVQHFYDTIDHIRKNGMDSLQLQDVLDNVQELKRLSETGLLDKYQPSEIHEVRHIARISSEERKNLMYQTMADMIGRCTDGFLMVERNLRDGVFTQYERALESKLDENQKGGKVMGKKYDFMDRANRVMSAGKIFGLQDADYINKGILEELETIEQKLALSEADAYSMQTIADLSEKRRTEMNWNPTDELPAYFNKEISITMPEDVSQSVEDIKTRGRNAYEDDLSELYANVYKIDKYASEDRVGQRGKSILYRDTLDALGDGYEAYKDQQFANTLDRLKMEHTGRNGLMGIDLTLPKNNAGDTKMRQSETEMTHDDVQKTETKQVSGVQVDQSVKKVTPVYKEPSSIVIEDVDDEMSDGFQKD